jgi:hypothetical protein
MSARSRILRRWLGQLRDPHSRQAFHRLYDAEAACALGQGMLACLDLLGLIVTERGVLDRRTPRRPLSLAQIVDRFVAAGFDRATVAAVIRLNDDRRLPLPRIADWLEQEIRKQETPR